MNAGEGCAQTQANTKFVFNSIIAVKTLDILCIVIFGECDKVFRGILILIKMLLKLWTRVTC